ncbi:mersacidin/lichenicidin family type 2 lantibiotic [Anabaena sp. CCY 9402-a]|uniref:mersacidin/lichenicidin family type 2 lantibiotic n=1 Tax=Anabaena sp. CCY 9402-a TaxID=3103867 RepID=UPI0039C6AE5C
MSSFDIIRAWKDEDYRNTLSGEQRSQLPENPAGMIELPSEVTQTLAGGKFTAGFICKSPVTIYTCRRGVCELILK